ncbi:MAG: N-6 DNA methylase [Candidatus Kapaibacterium sp.]|nr:MAG: N-6 DNA methylase [Candidatus Kapabacteria bacterium]
MHTPLFSPKALHKHLESLPEPPENALLRVQEWKQMINNRSVLAAKETELDGQFLTHFFRDVLGFSDNRASGAWTLTKNQTSHADSSVPDGVLGFFAMQGNETNSRVYAVIELKDASHDLDKGQKRQNDKRTPVEQAFSYAPKAGGNCKWVIVSNYLELRLYHHSDQSKYERFELSRLTEPHEIKRLLFLMHRENLLPLAENEAISRTEELFAARVKEEDRITKEFYAEYKQARNNLFKHLCAANSSAPELLVLNKTQKLLDRVIFVCFAEDKEIIPRRTFRRLLDDVKRDKFNRSDTKIWDRVRGLFAAINEGYPDEHINKFNGGLFADDAELDALVIKDSVLEHIIALEKYDFDSDLNVNILGHIFEQSITDIEELKAQIAGATHDASKGKRKKDGIFYTPEYITRYIVQETVGGYLEERKTECGFEALPAITDADWQSIKRDKRNVLTYNKTIERNIAAWMAYREKLAAVKVCDPACGSGAFLNQVFDFLYAEGQRVNAELARLQLGQTTTSDLQKDILQNNLYGVDVNPESVEITRLSLWLKTADRSKELTSLDHTIRCGNSLVDDPNVAGETAFDWAAAFPEVMQQGGFDVIVGNPPYVRQELLPEAMKAFLAQSYTVAHGSADLYAYFMEQSVRLLKEGGLYSIIVANKWMRASYGEPLRRWMKAQSLEEIIDFGDLPVFEDAIAYPCVLRMRKGAPKEEFRAANLTTLDFESLSAEVERMRFAVSMTQLQDAGWSLTNRAVSGLLAKLRAVGTPLGEYVQGKIYRGVLTGLNEAFVVDAATRARLIAEDPKSADVLKPFLAGRDVKRYATPEAENYLLFIPWHFPLHKDSSITGASKEAEQEFEKQYPGVYRYLLGFKQQLEQRNKAETGIRYEWYALQRHAASYYEEFEKPKIIVPAIVQTASYLVDASGFYSNDKTSIIGVDDKALLAVLNSKATDFFMHSIAATKQGGFYEYKPMYLVQLPIPPITNAEALTAHVETMITTTKALADLRKRVLTLLMSKTGITKASTKLQEWDALTWAELEGEIKKAKVKLSLNDQEELLTYFEQKKAEAERLKATLATTDRAIDALVYVLYGLTAEEIAVVKGVA